MDLKEFLSFLSYVLNFELLNVDGISLSLGKLLLGVTLLILSYVIARKLARVIDRRVLSHLNVDSSLRYNLQRFIFYVFLVINSLFVLHILNVPITIFTVIGGALAVGIGFGSQNLVNNFISGILVMIERPMRVGDHIEIDGLNGVVESIGIRSTRMRSLANAVVMIPNTVFIEKNLVNWTSSGSLMCKISLGVSYDTDVQRLKALCIERVGRMSAVLKSPAPDLLFTDFGDSALLFDLVFYVPSGVFVSRRGIESEIRYALEALFRENKINIPFPQRDISLRLAGNVDLGSMLRQSQGSHVER